jgi:hypothetical protein
LLWIADTRWREGVAPILEALDPIGAEGRTMTEALTKFGQELEAAVTR